MRFKIEYSKIDKLWLVFDNRYKNCFKFGSITDARDYMDLIEGYEEYDE